MFSSLGTADLDETRDARKGRRQADALSSNSPRDMSDDFGAYKNYGDGGSRSPAKGGAQAGVAEFENKIGSVLGSWMSGTSAQGEDLLGHFGPDGRGVKPKVDFGPDGMPLTDVASKFQADDIDASVETAHPQGVEYEDDEIGWYKAESGREAEEEVAHYHFKELFALVEQERQRVQRADYAWTNDPNILPLPHLPDVVPFLPDDRQLLVPAKHSDELLDEHEEASVNITWESQQHRWTRLVEYGFRETCSVFEKANPNATNCGRVFQGDLDNAYLVEALNAVSLRPKLARRLFYSWDVDRSIYIVRLFKNGVWLRVEMDDYVPVGGQRSHRHDLRGMDMQADQLPFCCRSEHFPEVLWPSLVEKAYAKSCTLRHPDPMDGKMRRGAHDAKDSGGWAAIGRGGRVDEALVDLTGGVGGFFSTRDVAPDRLFVYLHGFQRCCLFVCRVDIEHCTKNGIAFNPYASYAVNRAAIHESGCFVQLFCAHERGIFCGGLQDYVVSKEFENKFPEKPENGFFWLSIYDFHYYFLTIYECRLTNSPDVGIVGQPPPRLPHTRWATDLEPIPRAPGALLAEQVSPQPTPPPPWLRPPGDPTAPPLHDEPLFYEHVFANASMVTEHRPPEFCIETPETHCEIVATVEQTDTRITQVGFRRLPHEAIIVKAYEKLDGEMYSSNLVCKSNWAHVRSAMVSFKSYGSGTYKIIAEMPRDARCNRLIFRCYCSAENVVVYPSDSRHRDSLAEQGNRPSQANKWTFVGTINPSKLIRSFAPQPLDEDIDETRRRHGGEQCAFM